MISRRAEFQCGLNNLVVKLVREMVCLGAVQIQARVRPHRMSSKWEGRRRFMWHANKTLTLRAAVQCGVTNLVAKRAKEIGCSGLRLKHFTLVHIPDPFQ